MRMKNNKTTAANARLALATSKLVAARADFNRSCDEVDLDEQAADYDSGKIRLRSALRLAGTGAASTFSAADYAHRLAYNEALEVVIDFAC